VGDRLALYGLAPAMCIVSRGRAVEPTRAALRAVWPRPRARITVWVHGLGVTEDVWRFPGRGASSYGTLLERDAGFTPVFLRYNTGRAIRDSGAELDRLLEALCVGWPRRLREIVLVGYSMGGLVVRSALHHGELRSAPWLPLVRRTFHLGVPHLGTPLERAGRVTTSLLKALPTPYTKAIGAMANLRSAGVKDLAHGDLSPDGAWVPFPSTGEHHAIVGTLHADPGHILSLLLGDGLVPLASARARTRGAPAVFAAERIAVVGNVGHLSLPRSRRVYAVLRRWLAARRPARDRAGERAEPSRSGRRGR
jgi:triacylglycerol lipase